MAKFIRNLILFLKDLGSSPSQLIEVIALILLILLGFSIAGLEYLGYEIPPKYAAHLTLALMGLLAVHFCIERFTVMRRMERRIELLPLVDIKDIPQVRSLIESFVKSRAELRKLKRRLRKMNPGFAPVTDSIINEHSRQLAGLCEGTWSVPREWKLVAYESLMKAYKGRFDAVSENDLDYWDKHASDARRYLDIAAQFIKKGTTATRIFVLTRNDLITQTNRIIQILIEQEKAGFGWGLVIEDELDEQRRRLDCALHNGGQAVSVFRKQNWRYETIFATSENRDEISSYKGIYNDLVPECWLVNQIFANTYSGALTKEVEQKVRRHTDKLNLDLKRSAELDSNFFLIATGLDEIKERVPQLVEYYRKVRP